MSQDIYQKITATFIQQLEQGVRPWHQPWRSENGGNAFKIPVNGVTGKEYRGYNILSLWGAADANHYTCNQYATFKQWASEGEYVRQNENGNQIVFFDMMEKENEKHEIKKIPFLKVSYVFNRDQLKSFDPEKVEQPTPPPLFGRIEHVEQFVAGTRLFVKHHGDQAYYDKKCDYINMPTPELFTETPERSASEAYYATLLHEMGHATGHTSRLSREFGKRFGDKAYAFEELVAEITSAFMCVKMDITDAPREDHAQYLGHWIKWLKDDPRVIMPAASEASKAADYLENMKDMKRPPANDNCEPCITPAVSLRQAI